MARRAPKSNPRRVSSPPHNPDTRRRRASSGAWDQVRTGPERIGNYRIERELGRGCYGVVYLVQREGLERRFALKVLTAEALRSPEAVARFEREAKLASRIQDPGVVTIHDLGREGRFPYYVMDLVRGPTLQDRIHQGPLGASEAATLIAALARTMDSAHQANVLHRDLKPANVILDEVLKRPRVTDFGLAQEQGGMRLTRTGEAVGTPFYMAPEQNLGQRDLDARVDIYALGVLLYESLTGQVPFGGANFVEISHAIRRGEPTAIRTLAPATPPALEAICLKAMALDREARYRSAGDLAAALEGYLSQGASAASPARSAPRSLLRARSLALGAALVLGALLAGSGGLYLRQRQRLSRGTELVAQARAAEHEAEARGPLAEFAALELALSGEAGAQLALEATQEEERWARREVLAEQLRVGRGAALRAALEEAERARLGPSLKTERHAAGEVALQRAEGGDEEALADAQLLVAGAPQLESRLASVVLSSRLDQATEGSDAESLRDLIEAAAADPRLAGARLLSRARARRRELEFEAAARAGRSADDLLAILSADGPEPGPEQASALGALRAEAYLRRGRYVDALREAERARISTDPEASSRAGLTRAFALLRLERGSEAMTAFEGVGRGQVRSAGDLALAHFAVLARGDAAGGLRLLEPFLVRFPRSYDGWVLKGAALHRLGRTQEAAEAFTEALRLAPDHPRAHLTRAVSLKEERRWDEALASAQECRRRCEGEPFLALLRLEVSILIQAGRPKEALEAADRMVQAFPKSAAARVERSVASWQTGQQEQAVADLRSALQLDREGAYAAARPYGPQVEGALAQVEQVERAERAAEGERAPPRAGLEGLPQPAPPPSGGQVLDALRAKARAGGSLEQLAPLFPAVEAAAKTPSQKDMARIELLELLHRRGRYPEVIQGARAFQDRRDRVALHARYLSAMSQLWLLQPECMPALEALYHEDREGPVGLTAGAVRLSHLGRNVEGAAAARQAIARDPNYVDAYLSLAFCLNDQRQAEAAALVLARVGPLVLDHPRYHKALAFVGTSLGDVKTALLGYSRVIELTQPQPYLDAVRRRAWLLFTLNRPREALADARQVVRRSSEDLASVWLCGLCEFALGQRDEAARIWKECYARDPKVTAQMLGQTPPSPAREAAAAALGLTIRPR